jgi:hypothetical protein
VAFANAEAGVIGDPIFDTDAHDEAIQATKRAWQEHERRKKMEERQNTPGNGVEPFPFTMASNITLEPKEFLVDGFLGRYEVSAWYGPPDGGKSTVVVHAQACVAAGIEYCGRRVMHGPCLYVGAERGAVTKRRILARCREHGLPDIPLAVVDHAIDLRSGTVDTGRVIATAHELGELCGQPVVWINFDTWNRILAGGDENSSKDQGAVIKAVDHIHRETRAHVSFIHHVPVDRTDRMRGHGLVLGGVDLTARITKDSLVHVEVDKANDLIGKPAFAFDFKSVTLHVDTETGASGRPRRGRCQIKARTQAVRPATAGDRCVDRMSGRGRRGRTSEPPTAGNPHRCAARYVARGIVRQWRARPRRPQPAARFQATIRTTAVAQPYRSP